MVQPVARVSTVSERAQLAFMVPYRNHIALAVEIESHKLRQGLHAVISTIHLHKSEEHTTESVFTVAALMAMPEELIESV